MTSPCSNEFVLKATNAFREVGRVRKQRDNTRQCQRQWSCCVSSLYANTAILIQRRGSLKRNVRGNKEIKEGPSKV